MSHTHRSVLDSIQDEMEQSQSGLPEGPVMHRRLPSPPTTPSVEIQRFLESRGRRPSPVSPEAAETLSSQPAPEHTAPPPDHHTLPRLHPVSLRIEDVMDSVSHFFDAWLRHSRTSDEQNCFRIKEEAQNLRTQPRRHHINAGDLIDDVCDIQDLNFKAIGTTRSFARLVRRRYLLSVEGHRQLHRRSAMPSSEHAKGKKTPLLCTGDAFRFRRMNATPRPSIGHRQLRHMLAMTSNSDIFFAEQSRIVRVDPLAGQTAAVMDVSSEALKSNHELAEFFITTMDASPDFIMAGSSYGNYALTSVDSPLGTPPHIGVVSKNRGRSEVCHIDLHARRSQDAYRVPSAAICCNDNVVRILDVGTTTMTSATCFRYPVNATCTDPNGQLRLVVGDSPSVCITSADSGEVLNVLNHHRICGTEGVFGASWSPRDGGRYVATSAEDSRVLVYDARNWRRPVADIECAESCTRGLHFSPDGRWLLMATSEDFICVLDAADGMFNRAQMFNFFGRIAGSTWRPDGEAFWIANEDAKWGGLIEYEMRKAKHGPPNVNTRFTSSRATNDMDIDGCHDERSEHGSAAGDDRISGTGSNNYDALWSMEDRDTPQSGAGEAR